MCYIADASIANLGSDVLLHLRTREDATTFDVHVHDGDVWLDPMLDRCDVDAAEVFAAAASVGRVAYIVGRTDATHPFPAAKSAAYVEWSTSERIRP